jgi:hypothetical protein
MKLSSTYDLIQFHSHFEASKIPSGSFKVVIVYQKTLTSYSLLRFAFLHSLIGFAVSYFQDRPSNGVFSFQAIFLFIILLLSVCLIPIFVSILKSNYVFAVFQSIVSES